eukprot:Gb_35172 [translate_table: standard]
MEEGDLLDFEMEDLYPIAAVQKCDGRKKVIGLDDLLADHYKEKNKTIERESKRARKCSSDSSDEEEAKLEKKREEQLSDFVHECEKQVHKITATIEAAAWSHRIFGSQKPPPKLVVSGVDGYPLLHSFLENSELKSMIGSSFENEESLMLELLTSGWLLNLVLTHGYCDEFTVRWAFNLMAYSSDGNVETSACNFLCSIVLSGSEVGSQFCSIDWVPSYDQIKEIVQIYGYIEDCIVDEPMLSKMENVEDFETDGPPENIHSWLKFLAACCRARKSRAILSPIQAENLVVMVIRFFLDRRLQCLSCLLQECMVSIVNFFTDEEWASSMKRIASSLCHSLPTRDLNCLRLVECISGVESRIKELQKEVAYCMFLNRMDKKDVANAEEVIFMLTSINVKDKDTDFIQMYIHIVLADIWLWSNPVITENLVVLEMWLLFLRSCSCQISSTDWRAYASKVRNKASYLLQIYESYQR